MDPLSKPRSSSSSRNSTWLRNLCQVDWTCIFWVIVLGIATGIVQKAAIVQRPIWLGDSTTAYPHRDSNSVAFWVALVIPALVLLLSAVVLEFGVFKRQGRRQAWLMLLNVLLAMLGALAVTGFLTELFKRICGRLRPDFLDRCQPLKLAAGSDPLPYGTFPDTTCTSTNAAVLHDGKMSFPSGHSSCSMVIGLFGALYVLWAVHTRGGSDSLGARAAFSSGRLRFSAWLRAELLRLWVMVVVLFLLAWPWGVAVSRFRDNRHNVSDVVAGLLLGACFAPTFLARLVWHHNGWQQLEQEEEASALQLQLQQSNTAVLPVVLPPSSSGFAHTTPHNGSSNGGYNHNGAGAAGHAAPSVGMVRMQQY